VFGIPELVIFEDGTERNFIANAAPLLSEDYMPYGAVAAVLDITDRNRAEEALRK
jgi:PAS domain-containing protein